MTMILRSENGFAVTACCADALCVAHAAAPLGPHHFTVSASHAVTNDSHRYAIVAGPEVWCDTHDSAYPCTVTDATESE